LPIFVLGAALIGVVVDRISNRLALTLSVLLLLCMLPWVAYNQARPLVGPDSILFVPHDDQYFTNRPGARQPYVDAVAYLQDRGCARVGFVSNQDGWEYPLWSLSRGPVHIEHVGVTNMTRSLADDRFTPCAILAFGEGATEHNISAGGQVYQTSWSTGIGLDQLAVLTLKAR
jgi:hypothetical protein